MTENEEKYSETWTFNCREFLNKLKPYSETWTFNCKEFLNKLKGILIEVLTKVKAGVSVETEVIVGEAMRKTFNSENLQNGITKPMPPNKYNMR